MITLITGLPGNGKTLYTLWHLLQRVKKENDDLIAQGEEPRQVYICGVNQLAIEEWHQIDYDQAQKWYELPEKSIIVIDEAQRIFRPRAGRGEPPKHFSELETHRHHGFDIYLITQHPSLLDSHVRCFVEIHRHLKRRFSGMQESTIHEWSEVRMDCNIRRNDSSATRFRFPKEIYKLYKSAEMHTHKIHLPKQIYHLGALLLLLGFVGWYLYDFWGTKTGLKEEPQLQQQATGSVNPATGAVTPVSSGYGFPSGPQPMTQDAYIASLTPRITDFPHTAPRYDDITKPTQAPYPAGCYAIRDTCKCITQQGTPMHMTQETCRNIIEHGFFRDWEPLPQPAQPVQAPQMVQGV